MLFCLLNSIFRCKNREKQFNIGVFFWFFFWWGGDSVWNHPLTADDIDSATFHKIPLWAFGFCIDHKDVLCRALTKKAAGAIRRLFNILLLTFYFTTSLP